MSRSRTALLILPLAALTLAACGSDDESSSTVAPTVAPTEAPAAPASDAPAADASGVGVSLAETPLGTILVDAGGRTLYLFTKDEPGASASACTGDCATNWPALLSDDVPTLGEGLNAEDFGTTAAADGTSRQVTFYGHPLYYFAADIAPGDTNGQNVGTVWFVVDAEGNAVAA